MSTGGIITTVAGNGLPGFSGDGGPAASAQIISPAAVAVDSLGNIYFNDGSVRIRQIVIGARTINTIAGNGTQGYSGDGGLAVNAQLNVPSAVTVDPTGKVYIADTGNNAVRLLSFSGAGISVTSVVNGASNVSGPVAPGEVVVIYGSGLGPATLTSFQLGANGLVPTSVAGTSVLVNGVAAPVLYTSAGQVAAIVPFNVSGSTATISVVYQGQGSTPLPLPVAAASPAIFTSNSSGSGQAAALNQDASGNDAGHPAPTGSVVTFYATGAGQTNPAGQDGLPGAVPLPPTGPPRDRDRGWKVRHRAVRRSRVRYRRRRHSGERRDPVRSYARCGSRGPPGRHDFEPQRSDHRGLGQLTPPVRLWTGTHSR